MKTIIEMARDAGMAGFDGVVHAAFQLEAFAALVRADEREAILPMLKGIDQTECEDPDGWWETSTGADFGAGILESIRARGNT